jgi:hypothetical protein
LYFAPGLYAPTTRADVERLGHELTYVVQQRDGRVSMGRQIAAEIWSGRPARHKLRP